MPFIFHLPLPPCHYLSNFLIPHCHSLFKSIKQSWYTLLRYYRQCTLFRFMRSHQWNHSLKTKPLASGINLKVDTVSQYQYSRSQSGDPWLHPSAVQLRLLSPDTWKPFWQEKEHVESKKFESEQDKDPFDGAFKRLQNLPTTIN